ncbi:B-4DMT family transporter [Williamsia sp. CHRR-6]|uniref:B-4DMT family transporter n=1 Tax=Williamsia sp. CHRR-6 TaxID=2835871 RepID=UPI001BD9DC83|nr:B-4DMT family transporter [Williamsia sp. CHRR-6]MBT0568005.1 B-4DMT family transporter [Williamsia sp. CHRR-6]
MASWLIRGVPMALVHIVARILLGVAVVNAPLHGTWWKVIAVAVVIVIAVIWGGIDGISDGRAHDDPDDYGDLTVLWLKAGLVAGVISGVVCWALSNFALAGMGQNSFFIELIAGASFTALLVFVPAFTGAGLGRYLARREARSAATHDRQPETV